MTRVHYARDLERFTERDSQFLKTLPALGVGVKVGLTAMHAFDQSGRSVAHNVLHTVRKAFGDVIWDAKLDDIPTQIYGAAGEIAALNIFGFTVKASGGVVMLKAAVAARDASYAQFAARYDPKEHQQPPVRSIVFGVTVLSSSSAAHDEDDDCLRSSETIEEKVVRYARRIERAGCDGIVCPGSALAAVRREFGDRFVTLVTGIRPPWANWIPGDDQHHTISHLEAAKLGANHLVIGRPVYYAPDPARAIERILFELRQCGAREPNAA